MKYRAEIDGLRALAVIPVIIFHANFGLFSGGYVGVDVFFVISGFLITNIINEEIKDNRFSFKSFYERRARRILPVLYIVVIATLIFSWFVLLPDNLVSVAKSSISIALFSSNFYFWSERGYFGVAGELKPLLHTWSLAVEEQFYIFFPVILVLLRNYQKSQLLLLISILAISLGTSYYLTPIHFDTAFYFPLTRVWELLVGSLCAFLYSDSGLKKSASINDLLSTLGLVLVLYSYYAYDSSTLFPYVNALIPVAGTAIFLVASRNSNFIKRIFSNIFLVYIGSISFSLYLWHQPVFAFARIMNLFDNNKFVCIVITFALSVISYVCVERPMRNKKLVSTQTIIFTSLTGFLIVASVSVFYIFESGFPSRYPIENRAILKQIVEYQGYNQKRFDDLLLKKFSDDSKIKVVLVGDSYAKDFLNIIAESQKFDKFEFSTRQINSECGNLMINQEFRIERFIPEDRKIRCAQLGRYDVEKFDKILQSADEIWLVSSWNLWVIDYLNESIANINTKYNKPVRVFGLKNFGQINLNEILEIPYYSRKEYAQSVTISATDIDKKLEETLAQYPLYYPVIDDLCGGNRLTCKIFTEDGLLMSVDGGHLTKEGAISGASKLHDLFLKISNYSHAR